MKKILLIYLILIISPISVLAHGEETFAIAEEIIKSKTPCDQLTDNQLEILGDYYMEQMHPGEAHNTMDDMMGGVGSSSLEEMHINMGNAFYCGEHEAMGSDMMNSMMGGTVLNNQRGMMNMMTGSFFGMGFGILFMVIFWGTMIWLIIWLVNQYSKPKKDNKTESPIDILKKRYAKGEITKKQYEKMKKELK
jgi:putative membrane protein|tara:strand:- start:18 stop:596 length:579 start_codon:yes stop_codon:yes gene_type:complete